MIKDKRMSHNWTTPKELRQQIQRLWERGDLHRAVLDGMGMVDEASEITASVSSSTTFPIRLRLKKPSSREIGEHFSDTRAWIQSVSNIRYTRLELLETRHPQLGRNTVPSTLWIDSLEDAIAFIGKRDESAQFGSQVKRLVSHDIRLIDWVRMRPSKVLELSSVWDNLLSVHDRMVSRPRDTLYLRQLSVVGVDTKFIEAHRATLGEWLELTLPENSIDARHRGARGFARRFGFKDKPVRLRLRSLDTTQPLLAPVSKHEVGADATVAKADITLDVEVVQLLEPAHSRVIITENEINYLVLPDMQHTLAVFGSGYGLESLGGVDWLKQRDVWYWGDLDTHGFAILNELRSSLPDVSSLLMDRETLLAHESLWGCELKPTNRVLQHLTDEEAELYQDIVEHRYGDRLRLEQEQVEYAFMMSKLGAL